MEHIQPFRVIATFAAVASFAAHAFDGTGTIVSQGVTRDFIYHAPGTSVAEGLPMVLVYHGLGSYNAEVQYFTGFDAVADANNFVVVYPQSTLIGGDYQWNVYADDLPGHGGLGIPDATDDVVFTDDLIDWFCANHHIDASRIYATGHSNGGNFCYLLSLQRPEKFAAFAPTSANLWGEASYMTSMLGAGFTPVAIYHVHGDPDPVVNYPDSLHDPGQWTWPLSSFGSADCGVQSYTSTNIVPGVDRLTWCDGSAPNGKRVELIRCAGVGHGWGDLPGYSASNAIWEFFSGYVTDAGAFSCATGLDDPAPNGARLTMRTVVEDVLLFSRPLEAAADVRIMDAQGREVFGRSGTIGNALGVPALPAARYTVRIIEPRAGSTVSVVVKL
ncbi:MAG: prolyl oligopeptidase family serine peptidase [Flavobacteriales bacterium]|nr:prolyl oligopeptidase family serine peptidase [Flavobacteriales bacterium]